MGCRIARRSRLLSVTSATNTIGDNKGFVAPGRDLQPEPSKLRTEVGGPCRQAPSGQLGLVSRGIARGPIHF